MSKQLITIIENCRECPSMKKFWEGVRLNPPICWKKRQKKPYATVNHGGEDIPDFCPLEDMNG